MFICVRVLGLKIILISEYRDPAKRFKRNYNALTESIQ